MPTTQPFPQPPQRQPINPWKLLGIFVAVTFGWGVIDSLFNLRNYNRGEQAYQTADCTTAIEYFDRVINNPAILDFDDNLGRSEAKKSECREFQVAVEQQEKGQWETALFAYNDFIARHPESALIKAIRQQTASLFAKEEIGSFVRPQICEQLEPIKNNQLIPQTNVNLPPLYRGCADLYTQAQQHGNAVKLYEQFLAEYPTHDQVPDVQAALAQSMIAEARAAGAGKILPPGRSGITVDGSTVVQIRNDSPTRMRLVFSGPETQFQELGSCPDCQKYFGKPPESCPNKGPVGFYRLKPGTYEVVVKSIEDELVRPFVGNWSLDGGAEYTNCFFIVTQPMEQGETETPQE